MRVELTDGAWADIRDVSELRNADRKAVNKAVSLHIDENGQPIFAGDMEDKMLDALLRRVITGWSFAGLPLPADDPESLGKLTIPDADLLAEAVKEHLKLVKGNESAVKPGTDPTAG